MSEADQETQEVLTQDLGDQDQDLLQQFQTVDEDGNTIVLTAEQLQSYHEQAAAEAQGHELMDDGEVDPDAETQHIVQDILQSEEIGEEEDVDLGPHTIIDEHGNHQLVSGANLQDLITLHSVDADGNIVTTTHAADDEHEHLVDDLEEPIDEDSQEDIHIDQESMDEEPMIDTDHIVEEVITSGDPDEDSYTLRTSDSDHIAGNTDDLTQPFLSVRDSVFNPLTGTLQPISTAMSSTAPPPTPPKPKRVTKPQQVKYVIAQQGSDGQPQQLVLDAQQLQGLLQGGGNTITLSGASGKQSVFLSSSSTQKGKGTKSPAKILPAPVPIGDQQQGASPQRFLLKQGNTLTSLPSLSQGGTKLFQLPSGGGNQIQYVRVVPNKQPPLNKLPIPASSRPKLVAPKPGPGQTIFSLPPGTTAADISNLQGAHGLGNFVMLPNYMIKSETNTPIAIRPSGGDQAAAEAAAMLSLQQNLAAAQTQAGIDSFRSLLEPNGMRPRKPCNCTKSQCLKLYCDCFANGEFCHLCNCTNCYNNLNHEEDRQKAIKLVLERNPGAFRPKIGKSSQTGEAHERRHNKGCNCRRSGCLKNYCECYEAKIFCSGICKCSGCKNCIENIPSGLSNGNAVEQHFAGAGTSHRQTLKDLAEAAEVRVQQQNQVRNKMKAQWQEVSPQNNLGNMVPPCVFRHPHGSISYEVVTSTVELLLAKAESGEKQRLPEGELEKIIVEEFGECLASVMELGTTIGSSD